MSTQADPRVVRTRRLLQDALLELAREKSLDEITIADIADRAAVNRSTFYQHYADKETLLADALDEQAAAAGADLTSPDLVLTPGGTTSPDLVLRYIRHVTAHADLYRRALGEHGSPIVTARLRRRITALTMTGYALYGLDETELKMPVDIAAAATVGSLLGMLLACLESEPPPPPEQIAAWIWSELPRPHG